jgi:methyl-accepting chemotaxis protein
LNGGKIMERKQEPKKFYKRKIYIINKDLQLKYLFTITSMIFISVAAVSFVTFYVIWDNVIREFFFIPEAAKKLGDIFVRTTEIAAGCTAVILAIFGVAGIFLSHRVAGPLYRVERVAEEISKGNLDIKVQFRKSDELRTMADSLNKMISGIRGIVNEDKKIIGNLSAVSDKLSTDVKKQKGLKRDVVSTIKRLNAIIYKLKMTTDKFKT